MFGERGVAMRMASWGSVFMEALWSTVLVGFLEKLDDLGCFVGIAML